jgi:DNA-binding Lrp family transcriptional regulator
VNTGILDDIDARLVARLQEDGRQSNRELGDSLGISARQAGVRLHRLLDGGALRVIATVDTFAAGFDFLAAVGVSVNDPALEVAHRLAALPNVLSVVRMAGQYDIEMLVAAENHAALSRVVKDGISRVPGIRTLYPSLVLDVLKYRTGVGVPDSGWPTIGLPERSAFDAVDQAIVTRLWENARATNAVIAASLGLAESTVRTRISQMRRRNLVRITAMRHTEIGGETIVGFVGISLIDGVRDSVLAVLLAMPHVTFVANVLGRFDVLAQVVAQDVRSLTAALTTICDIPGVRTASCAQALSLVKYDWRWTMLRAGEG